MRFKSQWNGIEGENRFEPVSSKPSETIPDQSMSVDELMKRYASGLPLGGERVPIYHGEDEFLPNEKTLDLSEIEDLKIANQEKIDSMQKELSEKKQKKYEDALKNRPIKKVEKLEPDKGEGVDEKNDSKKS